MSRRWPLGVLAVFVPVIPALARAEGAARSLGNNVDYASALIYASGGDYLDAYRAFRRAYRTDRDLPIIWYNMGLAAAHIPGYEFRAAALLKAYELEDFGGGSDLTVEGAIHTLEGTANTEVDMLLQSDIASDRAAASMGDDYRVRACEARDASIYIAEAQAVAGHAAAASRSVQQAESMPGCVTGVAVMRSHARGLAEAFAYSGHFHAAATYAAMRAPRHPNFAFYEDVALREVEFNQLSAARAEEEVALEEARSEHGNPQALVYSSPEARLMYCADSEWQWRTGVAPAESRTQLVHWRNLAYRRDRFASDADAELVRDAATFAAEGDYGWADATAAAIHDPVLRMKWQGYRVPTATVPTSHGRVMLPLEATEQVAGALRHEPELLRCLGNSYFANLLLRIGTGQMRFKSCPRTDATLSSCIQTITAEPGGVRSRALSLDRLLRQALKLRTTIFEYRWYGHTDRNSTVRSR